MLRKNILLLLTLIALANSLTVDIPASHQMAPVAHQAEVKSPCKNGQQIVPNSVKSTSNGCGSKPWHVNMGKMLSPYLKYLNKCCDAHDHCFGVCSTSNFKTAFDKCNNDFKDCMYDVCDKNTRNSISIKLCKANAITFYHLHYDLVSNFTVSYHSLF